MAKHTLAERVHRKIMEKEYYRAPKPYKLILGREERIEWEKVLLTDMYQYATSYWGAPVDKPMFMGLEITWSKRQRYLCVLSRKHVGRMAPPWIIDSFNIWK